MMETIHIVEGAVYIYTKNWPDGCQGKRYRVLRINVMAVPEYQKKILVEALEGPDRGLWFVCSPHNFTTRYEPDSERNGDVVH